MNAEMQPILVTPYHVTNWMPFVPRETADGFEIVCRETPWVAISIHSTVVFCGFVGFYFLIDRLNPPLRWVAVLIGIPTFAVVLFGTSAYHRHQQKRGPILRYDRIRKKFLLPRTGDEINCADIDQFALVFGGMGESSFWQLQLIEKTGRKYLLLSAYTKKEIRPFVQMIRSQTKIPIRVGRQTAAGEGAWSEDPIESF